MQTYPFTLVQERWWLEAPLGVSLRYDILQRFYLKKLICLIFLQEDVNLTGHLSN